MQPYSTVYKHLQSCSNVSFRNSKYECSLNLCLFNVDVLGHLIKNDVVVMARDAAQVSRQHSMRSGNPQVVLQTQQSIRNMMMDASSQARNTMLQSKFGDADSNQGLLNGIYSIIF